MKTLLNSPIIFRGSLLLLLVACIFGLSKKVIKSAATEEDLASVSSKEPALESSNSDFSSYLEANEKGNSHSRDELIMSYFGEMIQATPNATERILAEAETLKESPEALIKLVGQVAASYGVEEASKLLELALSDQHYTELLLAIAFRGAHLEPKKVIALLEKENPYLLTDPETVFHLFHASHKTMPLEDKLSWVESTPIGAARQILIDEFGSALADLKDKDQVQSILNQLSKLESHEQRMVLEKFVSKMTQLYPESAFTQLKEYGIDLDRITKTDLFEMGEKLYGKSSWEQLGLLGASLTPERREIFKNGFIESWAKENPKQSADHALDRYLQGEGEGKYISTAMEIWFIRDPREAMDFLETSAGRLTGDEDLTILQNNFSQIVNADKQLAEEIIQNPEYQSMAEGFRMAYSKSIVQEKPERAFEEAGKIQNRLAREATLGQVAGKYASIDPEGAMTHAIESFARGRDRDRVLVAIGPAILEHIPHKFPDVVRGIQDDDLRQMNLHMLEETARSAGNPAITQAYEEMSNEFADLNSKIYEGE